MPVVSGKLLRWAQVTLPARMVATVDNDTQNQLFSWSKGFLAIHEGLSTSQVTSWTSTDGYWWHEGLPFDVTGLDNAVWIEQLVEGPAGLLALGYVPGCLDDGTGCRPQPAVGIWRSTDGLTWQRLDLAAFAGGSPFDMAAGPKGYLATGTTADGDPAAWLSSDGKAWHAVSLPATTFAATSFSGGYVLAGGSGITGAIGVPAGGSSAPTTPAIWWSADGVAWSREALAGARLETNAQASVLSVSGKLVAHVIGWDSLAPPSGDDLAWTSADGQTWKATTQPFPIAPAVVMLDGHQAVQVVPTQSGLLTEAVSPDALSWSIVPAAGAGPVQLFQSAATSVGILAIDVDGNLWLATVKAN